MRRAPKHQVPNTKLPPSVADMTLRKDATVQLLRRTGQRSSKSQAPNHGPSDVVASQGGALRFGAWNSLELGAWDLKFPKRVIPPKTARNHPHCDSPRRSLFQTKNPLGRKTVWSKSALRANALGLADVLMQGITHTAPATAVLLTIQFIASNAGVTAPLAYLVAFLIVLPLGVSLAQLAKHFPSAGGYYTYVRTIIIMGGYLVFTSWGLPIGWGTRDVNNLVASQEMPFFQLAKRFWGPGWMVGFGSLRVGGHEMERSRKMAAESRVRFRGNDRATGVPGQRP